MAINNLRAVLIDLSGTIHIEDTEIPGSIKALERYCETIHVQIFFDMSNALYT